MTLDQRQTRHGGRKPVHYPESDGTPMGETDLHRDEMYRLITTLQAAFAARPDVYVSGNLLLYHEKAIRGRRLPRPLSSRSLHPQPAVRTW